MFVLSLVGVTLMTIGGHFRHTARYAQSTRLEAQAAQILHSGLAWLKNHPPQIPSAESEAPILLDAGPLGGPQAEATLSLTWNAEPQGWLLTAEIVNGRSRLTRSTLLPSLSPESKPADSR